MIIAKRYHRGLRGECEQNHLLSIDHSKPGMRMWHLRHHNDHCKGLYLRALACREIGNRGNIMVL